MSAFRRVVDDSSGISILHPMSTPEVFRNRSSLEIRDLTFSFPTESPRGNNLNRLAPRGSEVIHVFDAENRFWDLPAYACFLFRDNPQPSRQFFFIIDLRWS